MICGLSTALVVWPDVCIHKMTRLMLLPVLSLNLWTECSSVNSHKFSLLRPIHSFTIYPSPLFLCFLTFSSFFVTSFNYIIKICNLVYRPRSMHLQDYLQGRLDSIIHHPYMFGSNSGPFHPYEHHLVILQFTYLKVSTSVIFPCFS